MITAPMGSSALLGKHYCGDAIITGHESHTQLGGPIESLKRGKKSFSLNKSLLSRFSQSLHD